jgi:hypothetical protein
MSKTPKTVNLNVDDAQTIQKLFDHVRPQFGGYKPQVVGAALADLTALWLAGHYVADDPEATRGLRGDLLRLHITMIKQMIGPNSKIVGSPPGIDYDAHE